MNRPTIGLFRRSVRLLAWLCGSLALGTLGGNTAQADPPARLATRVFGYIPYWTASKKTWDYQGLTDIALFSVGASDNGTLTSTTFWRSSQARTLIDEAHSHGVKVELAVTNFDPTSLHNLLTSPASVDALIAALVKEALVTQPGDGLSIDFEGLRGSDRVPLVDFIRKLRAAMKAKMVNSQLSLATPAVDWNSAYDYAGLAAESDTLFIMGYGYHWSGSSSPGPGAPLVCGAPWGNYCLSKTVAEYVAAVGPTQRHKIVLGLPLYGYDYPADTDKIGAKSLGTGSAVLYSTARDQVKSRRYEPVSQSPWYVYTDAKSVLHQVWYDDEESLGKKIDYIVDQRIGGVGFWALGYEDESAWKLIQRKLSLPSPQPPSPLPLPTLPPVDSQPPQMDSMAEIQGCSLTMAARTHTPGATTWMPLGLLLLGASIRRRLHLARALAFTISSTFLVKSPFT